MPGNPDVCPEWDSTRIQGLSSRERIVVVILDEIYCAQRMEYIGGQFFGMKDGKSIKTLLVFMIKSVAGAYMDVVAHYPVSNLDSNMLEEAAKEVMKTLHEIGFEALILSLDNAAPNRKFYTELCKGQISPSILHPMESESRLFLAFDSVHNLKNCYNNFVNKRNFKCPDWDNFSKVIAPSFSHIEELYRIERGKPVKLAHKLTDKMLHPSAIEKTNVSLADGVFHDSTIHAMKFYAENLEKSSWKDTIKFLEIVRHHWNIMNVKTPHQGQRKRDIRKIPIDSMDSDSVKFLQKFLQWIDSWESLEKSKRKKTSFTSETFLALRQTTGAMIQVTEVLLDKRDFEYVLLGQMQSDPIEKRFGWYRQLAGGNYWISVRQILEAEKSIKLKSLVKFSQLDMATIKDIFQENIQESVTKNLEELKELGSFPNCSEDLSELEDHNIIYYISGYIAKSKSGLGA